MKTKYETVEFVDLKPQASNRWHCFKMPEHIGECEFMDGVWQFRADGRLTEQMLLDIAAFLKQLNEGESDAETV